MLNQMLLKMARMRVKQALSPAGYGKAIGGYVGGSLGGLVGQGQAGQNIGRAVGGPVAQGVDAVGGAIARPRGLERPPPPPPAAPKFVPGEVQAPPPQPGDNPPAETNLPSIPPPPGGPGGSVAAPPPDKVKWPEPSGEWPFGGKEETPEPGPNPGQPPGAPPANPGPMGKVPQPQLDVPPPMPRQDLNWDRLLQRIHQTNRDVAGGAPGGAASGAAAQQAQQWYDNKNVPQYAAAQGQPGVHAPAPVPDMNKLKWNPANNQGFIPKDRMPNPTGLRH